ncbi:hypothetical protein ACFLT1_05945 [Bacteroidota bacterium]
MNALAPFLGLGFFMGFLVIMALFLLPQIFFLLTLHRTFDAISPQNRLMNPAEVWLTLIPLFGMIWIFIIVQRLADSLKQEFALKGISCNEERPGYQIGMVYAIVQATTIIPILGILASFATLVLWIVYWIKIAEYKRLLEGNFNMYTN